MTEHTTRIYNVEEAQTGILRRRDLQDTELPRHVQARVDEMFGEQTTALAAVQTILRSVREEGDHAVLDWTRRIDGVDMSGDGFELSKDDLRLACERTDQKVVAALRLARDRILKYHQKQPLTSWFTSDLGGATGQAVVPIERVGVYVPGGTAPLPSTLLMSAIPAIVAGSSDIVVVSPPQRVTSAIADVTLAACAIMNELPGVSIRMFKVGGAQAIAALAYGTATVPRVDKIVGPGNVFVSIAKKEVYGTVGIDGVYGPTEAVVIADDAADPRLVAADLLAQAEHDFLAVPILITPCKELALKVRSEIDQQVAVLSRRDVARHSMQNQGGIVLATSLDECFDLASEFATEHVSLSVKCPWDAVSRIKNAGGLFLGEGSCEVLGDYIAGPSHVMPTGGTARFSSPLSVLDFIKVISVVSLDARTVRDISPHAEQIARAEGLDGHAYAASLRKDFEP